MQSTPASEEVEGVTMTAGVVTRSTVHLTWGDQEDPTQGDLAVEGTVLVEVTIQDNRCHLLHR